VVCRARLSGDMPGLVAAAYADSEDLFKFCAGACVISGAGRAVTVVIGQPSLRYMLALDLTCQRAPRLQHNAFTHSIQQQVCHHSHRTVW
jgi:hypothetical protein